MRYRTEGNRDYTQFVRQVSEQRAMAFRVQACHLAGISLTEVNMMSQSAYEIIIDRGSDFNETIIRRGVNDVRMRQQPTHLFTCIIMYRTYITV